MKKKISYKEYRDKVLAGWIGKSLGGVFGASVENHKQWLCLTENDLWPDVLPPNDDLDIQVLWLEALQERGLDLTTKDLTDYWQDRCWYNFCEYGVFLNNVQRGINPPLSGYWNNSFFRESEGCPIRSEIWGFICPGNPKLAAEIAEKDAKLDHVGLSVEIEKFLSAAAAEAFFTEDLELVIKAGASVLSHDSQVLKCIPVVRDLSKEFTDPKLLWKQIIRKYGNRDASNALTNFALVLMALYSAQKDFKKTLLLCVNSGWDADCTAATAGALLGVMKGLKSVPDDWKQKLGDRLVCGINVRHKNALIADFTDDTCRLGLEMSYVKNDLVEFVDAPEVNVRALREKTVGIDIEYKNQPVLWKNKESNIKVKITNHTDKIETGNLSIKYPDGIIGTQKKFSFDIPALASKDITFSVSRDINLEWIPDKNMFNAEWEGACHNAETEFGIGGARQWQIYGPYWDMWNTEKYSICPYHNEEVRCHPHQRGLMGDSWNNYASLNREYLDENRLSKEDILEEMPYKIECGEDLITEKDTAGYRGQACYYFVRTIKSDKPLKDIRLSLGRSGPIRVWFDGQQLFEDSGMRCWSQLEDDRVKVNLTGKPQRLVVKFVNLADVFSFSILFLGIGDPNQRKGISYMLDCLSDLC